MNKPSQGYYVVDDALYYCQDYDWYYYDDGGWYYYDAPSGDDWYGDGYYGEDYPYFEDDSQAFERSGYYEEPSRSSSSDDDSSVFDHWDSSSTDWDSDW